MKQNNNQMMMAFIDEKVKNLINLVEEYNHPYKKEIIELNEKKPMLLFNAVNMIFILYANILFEENSIRVEQCRKGLADLIKKDKYVKEVIATYMEYVKAEDLLENKKLTHEDIKRKNRLLMTIFNNLLDIENN